MADTVFYSWQSDLPNATNRGFIQTALEGATKTLREDGSVQVEPVVDRDTAGVPGSPDISSTIFGKIDHARIFVCDVSIINHGTKDERRLTPNPNVLIELGYALKSLGQHRVIMVMNTAFGMVEQLPFDLRLRRVLTYNAPPEASDRASERKKLQGALEYCLRDILLVPIEKSRLEIGQELEIIAPGRWLAKPDRPGSRFPAVHEGQITPGTVNLRPRELYRFAADCGFTDDDLPRLAELAGQPQLRYLGFHNCKHLSIEALAALAKFAHLWDLDLSGMNATDTVLESLGALKGLKLVDLRQCNVSDTAVEKLNHGEHGEHGKRRTEGVPRVGRSIAL